MVVAAVVVVVAAAVVEVVVTALVVVRRDVVVGGAVVELVAPGLWFVDIADKPRYTTIPTARMPPSIVKRSR